MGGIRPNVLTIVLVAVAVVVLALGGGIAGPELEPASANATLFFEENFEGTALDATRWAASSNGHPAPTVLGGSLHVGQPDVVSSDFPYITSLVDPFPPAGNVQLQMTAQYTALAGRGDGVMVLGPGNELIQPRLRVRNSERATEELMGFRGPEVLRFSTSLRYNGGREPPRHARHR